MSTTRTNETTRRSWPSPTGFIPIYRESDFGTLVGGFYELEFTRYQLMANITLTNPLKIKAAPGGAPVATSIDGQRNFAIIYTGGGTMIEGTGATNWGLFGAFIIDGLGTSTLMNITGDKANIPNNPLFIDLTFQGWNSMGIIEDFDRIFVSNCGINLIGGGWSFKDNNNVIIKDLSFSNAVTMNDSYLKFSQSSTLISISSCTPRPITGDSFVYVDPTGTYESVDILGNPFDDSLGGTFFGSGSLDKTDVNITVISNGDQPDSKTIGSMFMEDNTTSTTITELGTTALITAFADSATSPGVKTTATSAAHGFTNGQTVWITNTTNYNGEYVVSNVATNTFDIIKVFTVDDATGKAENGWVKIAGTTIAGSNIERATMTGNNEITFINLSEAGGVAIVAVNATSSTATAKDCEFAVFKNSARISEVKMARQIQNVIGALSITAPTSFVKNDVFDVRSRNLTNTQSLLVENLQINIE